jgi:uncharacterized integral membrane protein
MTAVKVTLYVLILAAAVYFSAFNFNSSVQVDFYIWRTPPISLPLIVISSVVVGVVISYLFGLAEKSLAGRRAREIESRLAGLEAELAGLRRREADMESAADSGD